MKLWVWIRQWHCRHFHNEIWLPFEGRYTCRTCLLEWPMPSVDPAVERDALRRKCAKLEADVETLAAANLNLQRRLGSTEADQEFLRRLRIESKP